MDNLSSIKTIEELAVLSKGNMVKLKELQDEYKANPNGPIKETVDRIVLEQKRILHRKQQIKSEIDKQKSDEEADNDQFLSVVQKIHDQTVDLLRRLNGRTDIQNRLDREVIRRNLAIAAESLARIRGIKRIQ